jgi:diguanylate cyclase
LTAGERSRFNLTLYRFESGDDEAKVTLLHVTYLMLRDSMASLNKYNIHFHLSLNNGYKWQTYPSSYLECSFDPATATMQSANARLEGELAAAATEARALSEKLGAAERAAITDQLTGVLNRRGTFETLERLQGETRASGQKLSAAMLDIDHFKRFNDRFGHALGDDVLRFVARHVADRIAPSGGIVGRLGGEEFVALLPDQDVRSAAAIIDRVRAELAGQIIRNASDGSSMGRISFSAGVAGDRPDDNADSLIDRADKALYSAKRMGRDRVVPDR